jgi:hypothetical protein
MTLYDASQPLNFRINPAYKLHHINCLTQHSPNYSYYSELKVIWSVEVGSEKFIREGGVEGGVQKNTFHIV